MSTPSGTLRAFKITLEKQQAFVIGYPGEFDLDGPYQATLSMHDALFV